MFQKSHYERQYASIATRPSDQVSARNNHLLSALDRELALHSKPTIAELSIGDGSLSHALCRAFPSARLTFVDISAPHLSALRVLLARENSMPTEAPQFVELNFDAEFTRLSDDCYNAVIALDIVEHVFDVFGFINHCRRVLQPAGVLYLRVPNIAYVRHRLSLLFGHLPVTASWFGAPGKLDAWRTTYGWDGGHLHNFTLPTLRRLLSDSGFRVEHIADPGARFARFRGIYPNLFCGNLFVVARRSE